MTLNNYGAVKQGIPKFSIGRARRDGGQSKSVMHNPGPGQYSVPSKFVESAKFSFGLRYNEAVSALSKKSPGPGAYDADKPKKNDSKFSFGIKSSKDLKTNKLGPSPGTYEIKSFLSQTHGVGSFGKDLKLRDNSPKYVPGPGAYESDRNYSLILKKSATIKFGSSPRGGENKSMITNPGPGTYQMDGEIGKHAPKFSLSPKRGESIKRIREPGPGSYNPNSIIVNKTLPNVKFPKANRESVDMKASKVPGPLDYNPHFDVSTKTSAPSYGFGSARRPELANKKLSPGPGNYDISSQRTGPGFVMGIRIREKSNSGDSPSPGQYNPDDSFTKKALTGFKMSKSSRQAKQFNEFIPGPGSYSSQYSENSSKLFKNGKFGTSTRDKLKGDTGPGPGSYRIPSKIVEAPKYLFPNQDDSFAYT